MSARMLCLCALILAWLLTGRAGAQQRRQMPIEDTMAQRMQACAACHGQEGRSTNQGYFPRIAGKPAGYLHNQLRNFQNGRRGNAAMVYLVDHMSDAYMREIADHFSALDLPYPPPRQALIGVEALNRGQALVLRGDPARGIPSCIQCHGSNMTGMLPAFPGVLGLSQDYLMAQMGAWRSGLRKAQEPDCMHTVAMRLKAEDISAVANWLAAQPLPAHTKPSPPPTSSLPMACGSGPQ
jgi:cytochrome c553